MTTEDLVTFFQRAFGPWRNRIMLLVGRAILSAVDDTTPIQEVQLRALGGEDLDNVQRFQEYGFHSIPPAKTEAILVSVAGVRGNSVIIATAHRTFRPSGWSVGDAGFFATDKTTARVTPGGKFEVKNETAELVATLLDIANWLKNTAKVMTMNGPQPFTPDTIASLTPLITKLESFKL